jgi:hypothetical protein
MTDKPDFGDNGWRQIAQSNFGKWERRYQNLQENRRYGDETTYRMAAEFFADVDLVEDWGCGSGGFRLFRPSGYVGIDGSRNPFVDVVADLAAYTSRSDGILLRHVLEHNPQWEQILANALRSFQRKLCVIGFTPFSEKTQVLAYYKTMDVVDLSFRRLDLIRHFEPFAWKSVEDISTDSQYGVEHVFYVEHR